MLVKYYVCSMLTLSFFALANASKDAHMSLNKLAIKETRSTLFNTLKVNGKINHMKRRQLYDSMKKKNLRTDGEIDVLKKRVNNKKRKQTMTNTKSFQYKTTYFPYYVVIDFEAACTKENPPDYKFEIIEFPAILIDAKKRKIIDRFQVFVKPSMNSKLTAFCRKLTGISQDQIDKADPFEICLEKFAKWLKKHELGTKYNFSIVTDNTFDMARFLYGQCQMSKIPYPNFATKWVNIKYTFRKFYIKPNPENTKNYNLRAMLSYMGMAFEGNPHCGLDDSYNIAKICLRLLEDGAAVVQNEQITNLENPAPFGRVDPLPVRLIN